MIYIDLIRTLLGFFGIAIFAAWIFLGHLSGLVIFSISVITSLVMAWSLSDYSITLEIFLFLSMAGLGYYMRTKMQTEARKTSFSIEEIQRDKNILAEGMSSHRGVQEALKKKLNRFFQLKEFISSLSTHLNIKGVAEAVAETAFNIIGKADSCYFYIVDTQKQELALLIAKQKNSDAKIKNKNGDIFDRWVFKQRQSLFIEDVRKDYRFDSEKNTESANVFRSLISTPLFIGEKTIGSIRLNSNRPNVFLPDDLRLLDIISNVASVSLENTFLYLRTNELAITDSLTGIYVQKFFKERVSEEIARSLRGNTNLSVLLMDIDFFKVYNDTYGHMAGDLVLKKIANILKQTVQDSGNIVARYGGEEFGVILVNADLSQALETAQTIRKNIEEQTFLLRREKTKVTVSIGVASCPSDAKICEDLIKMADDALYKAKKTGRNSVCVKD